MPVTREDNSGRRLVGGGRWRRFEVAVGGVGSRGIERPCGAIARIEAAAFVGGGGAALPGTRFLSVSVLCCLAIGPVLDPTVPDNGPS
uniref:Uncharacterized protein n=1 Tax=Oryza sativa subsp. japonica TaxID=39947 RepID=Q84S60_ORYSJ|nr:hypothetical protein [Oryza sativa Japonica Group]BAD30126.1 hypothetical protein [Oryza sativa Japonica Group]